MVSQYLPIPLPAASLSCKQSAHPDYSKFRLFRIEFVLRMPYVPATREWLRLPTFGWAIILASFNGVGRMLQEMTHFFKRKNCAPPEMGLVTTNCKPSTGGLLAMFVQLEAGFKSGDDCRVKSA